MVGRGWRVAATWVAFVVSGCVGHDAGDLPDATDAIGDVPDVLAWGLTGCRFFAMDIPVDPAKLQPYVPEGFTPITNDGLPLPVNAPIDRAFLGLEAFECREGAGLNDSVTSLEYGSYWTYVRPPPAWVNASVQGYYVKWDTLVPDVDRREVLAAAGMPARTGQARVSIGPVAGGARLVDASLALDGAGGFRFTGLATTTYDAQEFSFAEFTPATRGLAQWRAVAQPYLGYTGRGVVEVEPGSWVADVMGTERFVGAFASGDSWTFANATLTLPS